MTGTKLIICGSIAIDRIMTFPGRYKELIQPDKLDIMSISVLGDSMTIAPGGIGLNIAYASAQLGETPILLSAAGQDTSDYLKH